MTYEDYESQMGIMSTARGSVLRAERMEREGKPWPISGDLDRWVRKQADALGVMP